MCDVTLHMNYCVDGNRSKNILRYRAARGLLLLSYLWLLLKSNNVSLTYMVRYFRAGARSDIFYDTDWLQIFKMIQKFYWCTINVSYLGDFICLWKVKEEILYVYFWYYSSLKWRSINIFCIQLLRVGCKLFVWILSPIIINFSFCNEKQNYFNFM